MIFFDRASRPVTTGPMRRRPAGPSLPERITQELHSVADLWKSSRLPRLWHRVQMGVYFLLIKDQWGVKPPYGTLGCGTGSKTMQRCGRWCSTWPGNFGRHGRRCNSRFRLTRCRGSASTAACRSTAGRPGFDGMPMPAPRPYGDPTGGNFGSGGISALSPFRRPKR
jgi:hypothetical protein